MDISDIRQQQQRQHQQPQQQDGRRLSASGERLRPGQHFSRPVTFHYEIQNHTTRMQKLTHAFKVYRLMVMTLVCVVAGLAIGLVCRPYARKWTERQFMYVEMPGELYLRFLKLMIIPLLVSNVILSFGTIRGKVSSRLGKVAGSLYVSCNLLAITVAISLAICIRPGAGGAHLAQAAATASGASPDYHLHGGGGSGSFSGPPQAAAAHLATAAPQNGNEVLTGEQLERLAVKLTGAAAAGQSKARLVLNRTYSASLFKEINRIGLSTKLPIDVVLDVLRNLFPDSLIGATMQQTRTRLFAPDELILSKNGSTSPQPSSWPIGRETVQQANVIGLLAVSVLTGVVLSHMGEEAARPVLELCSCVSELSLRIGMKAIHSAPICIMFLLIGQVARAHDLRFIASELIMYSLTIILALLLHGFVLLPLIYYLLTKKSPLVFLAGMLEALVASFATSSSSASMALSLSCLSELGLNMTVVRAFGPLGSVFNMNGTAIFEAVGTIFIAQTLGLNLPMTSLLLVGFCSAIASLSTSGIPSSGLMTIVIVLNAINLPVLQLSLIYIVDFVIDRFRTVVNVWSGSIVCGLIDHVCPENLFDVAESEMQSDKYREMTKYRHSRTSLGSRKSIGGGAALVESKPQVISITITPPSENSRV